MGDHPTGEPSATSSQLTLSQQAGLVDRRRWLSPHKVAVSESLWPESELCCPLQSPIAEGTGPCGPPRLCFFMLSEFFFVLTSRSAAWCGAACTQRSELEQIGASKGQRCAGSQRVTDDLDRNGWSLVLLLLTGVITLLSFLCEIGSQRWPKVHVPFLSLL